jgi:hypothetical protein
MGFLEYHLKQKNKKTKKTKLKNFSPIKLLERKIK